MCKGHAVYCSHTDVDIHSLPTNITLLYLPYSTLRSDNYDVELSNFRHLGLLNISHSQIAPNMISNFLQYLPNLRVLLMRNASIQDLSLKLFIHQRTLKILDLQKNSIGLLTNGCFMGLITLTTLDLHNINIYQIQPKSFDGMLSLRLLNLSSNELEYLDSDIFQSLNMLISVDLRGNTFKGIDSSTFRHLHSLLYVSTVQLCCYVEAPSICIMDNTR